MRIYFDVCCLSRLTDDQAQMRVRHEAQAIEKLMALVFNQSAIWIASAAMRAEISRNPDPERQRDAMDMLSFAQEFISLNKGVIERAHVLESFGFAAFDSLHLAYAKFAHVDVFLTTDDRLLRRAQRGVGRLTIRVVNPLSLLEELLSNADTGHD